ncbi:fibronectin type III domain-containing protein [Actinophytocola sp.]|uniref:fibronectin type III domain-containing protein n=1 Tax=Actinophytocola sp. TaxID=1872138 RepID=UPI002ED4668C
MRKWVAGLAALALTPVVAPAAAPAAAAPAPTTIAEKPYMGWSSWSLQATNYPGVNPNGPASWLNEANVVKQADVMAAKLKRHGYTYVNVDAGWHKDFDQYARPRVDPAKFPHGMKWLGDHVHRKGLKLGSYLAVGLYTGAYNNGDSPIYGTDNCHTRDIVYPDLRTTNGWDQAYKIDFSNPCAQAYIDSVADLLAGWGVDLLKLDGVGPGSFKGGENYDNTEDVKAYRRALDQTGRPIEFLISWALSPTKVDVWKNHTNGWRVDTDVECYCDTLVTWNSSVKQRWNDVVQWIPHAGPGRWNNLDSLNVGNAEMDGLNEAERLSYMTLWAIESSPLYLGDDLTTLDDYGLSLITNDEVIAINQAGRPAKPLSQATRQQVWFSRQADGSYVVALFNLDDVPKRVIASWADLGITGKAAVRDIWNKRDLGSTDGISTVVTTHGTQLLRVTPRDAGKLPATPTLVRGTGSTASSVSLAWDRSEYSRGIARYEIRAGNQTVASTSDTSATVSGLAPATTTAFSVVAVGKDGKKSAPSKAIEVTTPTGPVSYEAEAQENAVDGGASRGGCGGCSAGGKVGNLGGSGSLTYSNVTAPADGTYLMAIDYVDGSSSRTIVVTVNGVSAQLPMAGSADDNWDRAQRVVVPVKLKAGANTVKFGNPNDYAPDIDRITV